MTSCEWDPQHALQAAVSTAIAQYSMPQDGAVVQVLQHGLQPNAVLAEQVQRGHLASGSTLQAEIVSSTFAGPRIHYNFPHQDAAESKKGPVVKAATAKLLGHSQNILVRGQFASFDTLLAERRRLEREAAELRNALDAAQQRNTKQTSLEKLDAASRHLVQSLAQRQKQAAKMVRFGSNTQDSDRRGHSASGRDIAPARASRIVRSGLLLKQGEQAERRSTLPSFRMPSGLVRMHSEGGQALLDDVKVSLFKYLLLGQQRMQSVWQARNPMHVCSRTPAFAVTPHTPALTLG